MISESVTRKRLEYSCCQRRAVLARRAALARRAVLALGVGAGRTVTSDWPFRREAGLESEIVMLP
jgi:hypothetical protein